MMRSLWSAVSGLQTHQLEMDVIGNNIANVNTTSYKAQSTGFQDVLYQTIKTGSAGTPTKGSTSADQVGLGAKMGSINISITKAGSAQTTYNPFDLMITGDSFFVVSEGAASPNQEKYFTRDGSFTIDAEGSLVTQNNGLYVNFIEGEGILGNGEPLISDRTKTMAGQATSEAYLKGNIDRDDKQLVEGRTIQMDVYGNDGNVYTINFKLTDNADDEDNTYSIQIDKILDKNGNKISNTLNEKLTLTYDHANGRLTGITPYPIYTLDNGVQELDDDGNVLSTTYTMDGRMGQAEFSRTLTGKDGNQYTIYYSIDHHVPEEGEEETDTADYDFNVVYVRKGEGTRQYINKTMAVIDYDSESGNLLTIDGENAGEINVDLSEIYDGIGDITFDISNTTIPVAAGTSYRFEFNGEADVLGSLNVDFSNTSNYASSNGVHSSSVSAVRGDTYGLNKGYPNGDMNGITISDNGSIYAKYSNGQDVKLAQIVVAEFNNAMGLEKVGDNLYSASLNSGEPMYMDITEDGGYMSSGVLEASNVDLAKEFTDMITTQRGFQANSRVITTSDELLQVLKNLKR